jgi:hypothetical protein
MLLSHVENVFLNYILICLSNQSFRVERRKKEWSFALSVRNMASSVLISNPLKGSRFMRMSSLITPIFEHKKHKQGPKKCIKRLEHFSQKKVQH